MRKWCLAVFLLIPFFVAVVVGASGNDRGDAVDGTSDDLIGTAWILDAPKGGEPVPGPAVTLPGSRPDSKIRFDLRRLNADGLRGPPDGLRALHYEYCIPDRPEAIEEVTAVDPSLQIQRDSPGRAGCGETALLCLGHTHQPGHRAVLERLAALLFVAEIRESFFE